MAPPFPAISALRILDPVAWEARVRAVLESTRSYQVAARELGCSPRTAYAWAVELGARHRRGCHGRLAKSAGFDSHCDSNVAPPAA